MQTKHKVQTKPPMLMRLQVSFPYKLNLSKTTKILIFILLLVLYGSIILHKFQLPAALDMARFLQDGRQMLHHGITKTNYYSYTQPNTPFINYSWLSSIVYYLVYLLGGFVALNFFGLAVFLASFIMIFYVAQKRADFYLVALLSLPAILILGIRSDVRPEMFSYLFFALDLLLLNNFNEKPKSKKIWWMVPIQVIWVNMHIFFYLGPALAGGFLLERLILDRHKITSNPVIKKLAWLLIILTLACLVNPFGLSGALVFFSQWKDYLKLPFVISENISVKSFLRDNPIGANPATEVFMPAAIILLASFIVGFTKKRRPILLLLLAISLTAVAYNVLRGLALFAYIFLLAASANLNELFLKLKSWSLKLFSKPEILMMAALLFFAVVTPYLAVLNQKKADANEFIAGIGLAPMSNAAGDFVKNNHLSGPIFNDADIGSYLIFELYPKQKVFADNRFGTAYTKSFFEQYNAIFTNKGAWQNSLDYYKFNNIVIYQQDQAASGFLYDRSHDPQWALVYADRYNIIFVKNTPTNQNIIEGHRITSQNIQDKIKFLTSSNDANDQIAAGDIFNMVGRNDLAIKTDMGVVARWPDRGRIWFVLGNWELLSSKDAPAQYTAIADLQNALRAGYQISEVYTYLGAADFNLGFFSQAKVAAQKAIKLDPTNQDAKALMNVVQNGQ